MLAFLWVVFCENRQCTAEYLSKYLCMCADLMAFWGSPISRQRNWAGKQVSSMAQPDLIQERRSLFIRRQ